MLECCLARSSPLQCYFFGCMQSPKSARTAPLTRHECAAIFLLYFFFFTSVPDFQVCLFLFPSLSPTLPLLHFYSYRRLLLLQHHPQPRILRNLPNQFHSKQLLEVQNYFWMGLLNLVLVGKHFFGRTVTSAAC